MSPNDILCFIPKFSLLNIEQIRGILKKGHNIKFRNYDGIFSESPIPYFDIHDTIEHHLNTILEAQNQLEAPQKNIIIFDYGLYIRKLGMAPGATINHFYQAMTPETFEKEFDNESAILTFAIGYYDGKMKHYFSNNFDVVIRNLNKETRKSWLDCLIPPSQSLMLDLNFCDMETYELLRYHSSLFQCQKFIDNIRVIQLFTANKFETIFIRPQIAETKQKKQQTKTSKVNIRKINQYMNLDDEDDLMLLF